LSGQLRSNNGTQPGIALSYINDGKNQVGTVAPSVHLPWLDDRGTSLNLGAQGTVVMQGNDYNHAVGLRGEFNIPYERLSSFSLIVGLGYQATIQPGDGYKNSWIKPDIGLGYNDRESLRARLTTGPRVSDDRHYYWDTSLSAVKKFRLTESLHLDNELMAGLRSGDIPPDQLYRGLEISSGYEGISPFGANAHAGGSSNLFYDIIPNQLAIGAGVSGRILTSPFLDTPLIEAGAGVQVRLWGARIMIGPSVHSLNGKTVVTPLNLTFGYGK
jgi:hypothetical protein